MIPESQNYKELKAHLREMFQMDQPDLDFGIYRIMNQKREEIEKFLDKDLLPQVQTILKNNQPNDKDAIQQEITKLENNLRDAGIDPQTSPKIQALRTKLTKTFDIQKLESELYSDLYNFFKRYYSEGDFMSLRRYKQGVYALPYEGEEVKLHWANHDQYYIKTSENLKNYSFKTGDNQRVRFEITQAGTELNNNKADKDKERRFILHSENPITENGNELVIRFEFRSGSDKRKQDDINKDTVQQLKDRTEIARFGLLALTPTDKNPNRTKLEKHLTDFTAKNSFDYFIHKDLGKFLRQELDFYIKNEIMHLDDIENQTTDYIEGYLSKIRAMRSVAGKIITFLASLEDFQKKLWLKKKFVLDTHYCITLDHIIKSDNADELLGVIASNQAQIDEWVKLFAINKIKGDLGMVGFEALGLPASGSPSFPTEVRSTRERESYDASREDSLSFLLTQKNGNDESLQNGDAVIPAKAGIQSNGRESVTQREAKQSSQTDGSPSFPTEVQSTRERESYNASREDSLSFLLTQKNGNDESLQNGDASLVPPPQGEGIRNAIAFLRQNDKLLIDTKFFDTAFKYRLLSLFDNLDAQTDGVLINSENFQALNLLTERYREKIKCIYIDPPYNTGSGDFIYKDAYQHSSWLSFMENRLAISRNLINQSARFFCSIDDRENSKLLELLFQIFGKDNYLNAITWEKRTKSQNTQTAKYMLQSKIEYIHPFRFEDKRQEFNLEISGQKEYPFSDERGNFRLQKAEMDSLDRPHATLSMVYDLLGVSPKEGKAWKFGKNTAQMYIDEDRIHLIDGFPTIRFYEHDENQDKHKPFWSHFFDKETYGTAETGLNLLDKQMGFGKEFQTVKPIQLISKILFHASDTNDLILDYFAGSGTTGHAVIHLNREDNGSRKYILTEMATYFSEYTKPRIQKAVYSKDWKDGKPVGRDGVSHIFKYMTLEQYEDSLDNLGDHETGRFGRTQGQQEALDNANKSESGRRFYEGYMLSYMLDIESRGSQSLLNIDKIDNPFDYRLKITRNDETQIISVDLIETFNYLLGLVVDHIDLDKSGIITVKGINALGENCMIIWRNVTEINNAALDKWFSKRYSAKDFEFDAIYVNGDNNIENMKLQGDMWKVRLIESEFKRLMFSVSDI